MGPLSSISTLLPNGQRTGRAQRHDFFFYKRSERYFTNDMSVRYRYADYFRKTRRDRTRLPVPKFDLGPTLSQRWPAKEGHILFSIPFNKGVVTSHKSSCPSLDFFLGFLSD